VNTLGQKETNHNVAPSNSPALVSGLFLPPSKLRPLILHFFFPYKGKDSRGLQIQRCLWMGLLQRVSALVLPIVLVLLGAVRGSDSYRSNPVIPTVYGGRKCVSPIGIHAFHGTAGSLFLP
jgi:hypothetical protein